jgi:predicted Zn-dependent protease
MKKRALLLLNPKLFVGVLLLPFLLQACSTSPLGRKQLDIVSDTEMNQQGAQAFTQLKQQTPVDTDPKLTAYVRCVANPIVDLVKDKTGIQNWEIVVFKDDKTVNAFALPGGKIGVYTGLLKVATNDAQLATVLGHETGHVLAKHGGERVSQQMLAQGGLAALGAASNNQALVSLLGVGTQVGILLPFSRTQESEADLIGLDLMARAGFDPEQSVALWKNMMASSQGGTPPEILSDHPADDKRIASLQEHMPDALAKYDRAKAQGHARHCVRPQ